MKGTLQRGETVQRPLVLSAGVLRLGKLCITGAARVYVKRCFRLYPEAFLDIVLRFVYDCVYDGVHHAGDVGLPRGILCIAVWLFCLMKCTQ